MVLVARLAAIFTVAPMVVEVDGEVPALRSSVAAVVEAVDGIEMFISLTTVSVMSRPLVVQSVNAVVSVLSGVMVVAIRQTPQTSN